MFYVFPMLAFLPALLYVGAAVLPACVLLCYVYRHDTVEKEPTGLLLSLLAMGALSALCSGVLELIGETALNLVVSAGSPVHTVLLAFLVVAAVEEGTKLWFMKRRTWSHPAFNYRFDGIVYAVFVSLGFAALENIQYVANYGLSVALPRALLAVPGHMAFSIFMGFWYARAKIADMCGDADALRRNLAAAYVSPVLLHGLYDACAMSNSGLATGFFLVFVGVLFFAAFRTLKRESALDEPV